MKSDLKKIQQDLQKILKNEDFENAHVKARIENSLSSIEASIDILERPERPEKCKGFPSPDCNRKPSKYHDLHNSWYCISCWNEKVAHYMS